MSELSISEYIDIRQRMLAPDRETKDGGAADFSAACEKIRQAFFDDWENRESSGITLEIQKRAIIGYEKEKAFFKDRISVLLERFGLNGVEFPPWYRELSDAVYHENWGLAGLSEWFLPEFSQSSSAKIVAGRIYFMQDGRMKLRPQTISEERRQQLIRAFLLLTPEERMDKAYYETYLLDGTRVTIFTEPMAKKGQSCLIFRRYIIPELTFEEQARRGTIPADSVDMLKAMVAIGYNVVFMGAVRTAKTTFLGTWQSCEDPTLEGVMVETDPEIPMHRLLPDAPILQLIADGEDLRAISKNLLRSDADYFILAEARDGIALDTAVRIACKGTKRMKLTFHSRDPSSFPLEAASEIVKTTGGDIRLTMSQIAGSFDYLFHFIALSDRSQKRLKGIYQMNRSDSGEASVEEICGFDVQSGVWTFRNAIGERQRSYGRESDPQAFSVFERELRRLSGG